MTLEGTRGLARSVAWKRMRVVRREKPSRLLGALVPVVAVITALLVGGLLPAIVGMSPVQVYLAMIEGVVRSRAGLTEVLVKLTPILLAGLGVSLAFSGSFWNIGAEGQIFMGAIASFGAATLLNGLPAPLMVPAVLAAGFLGGALWGAIPAALKVRYNANEVVTTLMLNYIAQYGLYYLVHGPWKQPQYLYPWSWEIPKAAMLPRIPGTRIHLGLLFGLAALVVVYLLIKRTFFGYEIRLIGANSRAARACGIDVARRLIVMMLISGGLAGIAGMSEVTGLHFRLKEDISLGFGFTAITAALLGRLDPLGTAVGALMLSLFFVGGQYVQRVLSLPFSLIDAITALVVLMLLAGRLLTEYRLVLEPNRS